MSITPTRAAAWTVATLAFLAVLAALAGGASAVGRLPVVMTAHNARLHATILVNRSGHTLYNLSVERKGRFICTESTCLSLWHPLVVAKGVRPTGRVPLATVRRPDGRIQVTYKGAPLYAFVQDTKRGDTRGEGFKDVGVWHATTVGAKVTPAPAPSPGGYGY
jgi:predicted lipoprotein with Yx(FWY)xxD motif